MAFFKRRLIFWLVKAYLKKSGGTIFVSFLIGLLVFFLLKLNIGFAILKIIPQQKKIIGVVGSYTLDTLPYPIISKFSKGLTVLGKDSLPQPGIADSWSIRDGGKTYVFSLNHNTYFNDHKPLTSYDINYGFSDVSVERPDAYTIVFKLKDKYSPFLITVSQPVFKNDFVGTGEYKIKDIRENGNFIESLVLAKASDSSNTLEYQFYATEDSLKMAYTLGEIDKIDDLHDPTFQKTDFSNYPNTHVEKGVNYKELVAVFYNTKDPDLNDKRLREALKYSIPNSFLEGQRNYTPYDPDLWVNKDVDMSYDQDISHAKRLTAPILNATTSSKLNFVLTSLPQYSKTAETLSKYWNQIGIHVKIEYADQVPVNYQIYLGKFEVPKDPDQYSIWHSDQESNISHYKNLRIDKLLEDGRKTVDVDMRRKIYQDFEKYFLDDPPASFLFFPYTYSIERV